MFFYEAKTTFLKDENNMNKVTLAIMALLFSPLTTLNASDIALKEEKIDRTTPHITYDFLTKNVDMSAQFSTLMINGQEWHFHWHMDIKAPLEDYFPPSAYTLFVNVHTPLHADAAGIYASYDIFTKSKIAGKVENALSPFYLTIPEKCAFPSHSKDKMYTTADFGFNNPLKEKATFPFINPNDDESS